MMPLTAILRHELRTLLKGWLVRLWLLASLIVSLMVVGGGWRETPTAPLIAQVLFPFLVFPWFLVVMVLGVSPVTGSRLEALADGILSRPITRHEFLLGSWAARVVLVLGVLLLTTVPPILCLCFAERPADENPTGAMAFLGLDQADANNGVTLYGTAAAVGVVALVLTFQVSLAFLLGTLLRNPLWTIVVLLFFWYPINILLHQFQLEEFSPLSLSQAVSTLVRQPPPWVENPQDEKKGQAVSESVTEFAKLFGSTPKEPAKGKRGKFFDKEYEDFSLTWVVSAYGVLTAASIGLTMLCFGRRDL